MENINWIAITDVDSRHASASVYVISRATGAMGYTMRVIASSGTAS